MGVSNNSGTPKMDGVIRENPIKMDDSGGPPLFFFKVYMAWQDPFHPHKPLRTFTNTGEPNSVDTRPEAKQVVKFQCPPSPQKKTRGFFV